MNYYDQIKEHLSVIKSDERKLLKLLENTSDFVCEIAEYKPEKAKEFMRNTHEILFGKHFNRTYAECVIGEMFSKNKETGKKEKEGAIWTYAQIEEVYSKYKPKLHQAVNTCDLWVAIESFGHDLGEWLRKEFPEKWEEKCIEASVIFFFFDGDAENESSDKIWEYIFRKND